MPTEWNNTWCVSEDELIPDHYPSYEALKKCMKRHEDKPYGPKRARLGGHGRQMLVSFDSLPKNIQEAIGDPRRSGHILDLYYQTDLNAVQFFKEYQFADGCYMPFKYQEEYITNASVLQACSRLKAAREQERRSKGGSLKGVMTSICADAISFQKLLQQKHQVTHTLPVTEKRFKEAFKLFHTESGPNYSSLISGKLKNSNAQKVTDEIVRFLDQLFAGHNSKPTRSEVNRQYDAFLAGYVEVINEETAEAYDPESMPKISDSTIINYLDKWDSKIGTHARRSGNTQTLRGKFLPHYQFAKPAFAGSLISVDDREAPFWYEKGKRPVFYLGVDGASGAWTFWVHGTEKKGIMLEAYRQMVRNYVGWGLCLPAEIECEVNGNSPFANSFLRDGYLVDKVRMIPNNARAKMVERFIGYMRYNEKGEKGRFGWMARPFARNEANQAGPDQAKHDIILPYNQIVDGCLRDIENWNNSEHPEHPGKTRFDIFMETQNPSLRDPNWRAFLPQLGYTTPTSVNAGMVMLQGEKWLLGDNGELYTGDSLIKLMRICEGQNVTAYWLDGNDGKVMKAILCDDEKYICELIVAPRPQRAHIEKTPADHAAYELMAKYENTIEAYMKKKAAGIERVLVIDNRETTLNRRFQIPGINRQPVHTPEETEPETVPDINEDDDFLNVPTTAPKSLLDRF